MTSEEYEEQSAQCMVWAGNSAEQQRTLDVQLNAIGGVQQALLGILVELRRSNDDRSQWYREVLDVLSAAKAAPPRQCWKTKRGPQPVVGDAYVYRCVLELGHDGKCTDGERMEWK